MKKQITRTITALTITALAVTGITIATNLTPAATDDTGWGAPATTTPTDTEPTTTPADTGWGTPPTDIAQGDTGWG